MASVLWNDDNPFLVVQKGVAYQYKPTQAHGQMFLSWGGPTSLNVFHEHDGIIQWRLCKSVVLNLGLLRCFWTATPRNPSQHSWRWRLLGVAVQKHLSNPRLRTTAIDHWVRPIREAEWGNQTLNLGFCSERPKPPSTPILLALDPGNSLYLCCFTGIMGENIGAFHVMGGLLCWSNSAALEGLILILTGTICFLQSILRDGGRRGENEWWMLYRTVRCSSF